MVEAGGAGRGVNKIPSNLLANIRDFCHTNRWLAMIQVAAFVIAGIEEGQGEREGNSKWGSELNVKLEDQ